LLRLCFLFKPEKLAIVELDQYQGLQVIQGNALHRKGAKTQRDRKVNAGFFRCPYVLFDFKGKRTVEAVDVAQKRRNLKTGLSAATGSAPLKPAILLIEVIVSKLLDLSAF
jgi:hypothetical protein